MKLFRTPRAWQFREYLAITKQKPGRRLGDFRSNSVMNNRHSIYSGSCDGGQGQAATCFSEMDDGIGDAGAKGRELGNDRVDC